MTNLHKRMLPDWRFEPATVHIPGGCASDRATRPIYITHRKVTTTMSRDIKAVNIFLTFTIRKFSQKSCTTPCTAMCNLEFMPVNLLKNTSEAMHTTAHITIWSKQAPVYAKTVGQPDKTRKFLRCPTIVFSFSVCLSNKFLIVN